VVSSHLRDDLIKASMEERFHLRGVWIPDGICGHVFLSHSSFFCLYSIYHYNHFLLYL
jgi:hypothetical protein